MSRLTPEPGHWSPISTASRTRGGKVRARTRYHTPAGAIVPLEAVGATEREATERLHHKIHNWEPPESKVTFAEVAAEWLDAARLRDDLRPQTLDRYRTTIHATLLPELGDVPIRQLNAPHLRRTLDAITARTPGNHGACMTVCAGIFSHAVNYGIIPHTPMATIKRNVTKRGDIQVLNLHQVTQLRRLVTDWQDQPRRTTPLLDVMDLALATAARISELLALTWNDVDLDGRSVTFAAAQVTLSGHGTIRQPETKESVRLKLRLADFGHAALLRRYDKTSGEGYVFATKSGTMIGRANLDRAWRDARGNIYDWVTWHTFRRSVATLAAEEYGPQVAAQYLGHVNDSTTRRHYIARGTIEAPDLTGILDALAGDKMPHFDDDDH